MKNFYSERSCEIKEFLSNTKAIYLNLNNLTNIKCKNNCLLSGRNGCSCMYAGSIDKKRTGRAGGCIGKEFFLFAGVMIILHFLCCYH